MGQALSGEEPHRLSREELTHLLARRFAEECFTSLELFSFKDVFKSLADHQDDIRYLKEDTIARFLEIPDILHASPVIFQMASYIGAFPFLRDAPAVLGLEQMVMVVTIMTNRYKKVLARGSSDRTKLLFKSLAVYDRKMSETLPSTDKKTEAANDHSGGGLGFAIDKAAGESNRDDPSRNHDDEEEEEDDDDLEIAAFELLDINDAVMHGDAPSIRGAMIPADNFRKLLMLLILIAPLESQESLSAHATTRVVGNELDQLRTTAESVLAAFLNVENAPGIKYSHFNRILPVCFPYLFQGFNALFEHFLFSKNLDFSKHKHDPQNGDGEEPKSPSKEEPPLSPIIRRDPQLIQPLLQDKGDILNLSMLSQLSFFIPGSTLFRRLRLLYNGNEAGFSMGSFETGVFNWRAPTILLVRGTRIEDDVHGGQDGNFAASLPPKRFPHGSKGTRLTFGIYVSQPWKYTSKECFGEPDTVLFQLEPVHDVFPASALNRDYVAFTKPPSNRSLLAAGCPHPRPSQSHRRDTILGLGPVSLLLDSSFEYAVFNHDYTSRGGAFRTSTSRKFNFQDRFRVEGLEVWGCGGDAEAKAQAERWAWEAREAEARRKVNLGTGDIQADRALLEMAGIIGGDRSGGSMG